MKALFASPRRRRRAGWIGSILLVAGALAFVGVRFANTGRDLSAPFTPGPVQRAPATPKKDPFTQAERKQVRAVAAKFVSTAVFRDHVADSWEITAPNLRQGISRTVWASGTIPVVPYPGDAIQAVRWRTEYSFDRRVGLKVAFYPKPGADVLKQVFDIELRNVGSSAKPRWLVWDWVPSGGPSVASAAPGRSAAPTATLEPLRSKVRPIWLLAPVLLVAGSLIALVVWLTVRGWLRQSRANRAYSKF